MIGFTSFVSNGQHKGIIHTDRSQPFGIVSFPAESKLTGIGDTGHVDGYVETKGDDIFIFPVGNNGTYRPFAAAADGVIGAYFQVNPDTASLPSEGPYRISNREPGISNVSKKEFWDINGSNTTRITLSWNAGSDIKGLTAGSLSKLSIIGWNVTTSRWEKITSTVDEMSLQGGVSSLTAGSITTVLSIVPNSYSIYTLGIINAPVVTNDYTGNLESANCTEIKGWVWDRNYPDATGIVELVEGDIVHATAPASLYRDDLKNSGMGTGNYGFSMSVPESLNDGKIHNIGIRVRSSSYNLVGSPKTINCAYDGEFDSADCLFISGWAWDKNNPNVTQAVELFEGNVVYATVVADIYRPDLDSRGIGNGRYGFNFKLPEILKDGKSHQLNVRLKNINYKLKGSGKSLICSVAQYGGNFDFADCNVVSGWVWDKQYPTSATTVELMEGNNVHATTSASTYRADLKNAGMGTGNYGFNVNLPASLKDGNSH
ncbi:MAG TPA: T9SS C-terminal target domain-containing protein, partial [Dyadobacter sp.]|nr:T9SS C-terminal target domain-containing protein [Dyadobacter sp.]